MLKSFRRESIKAQTFIRFQWVAFLKEEELPSLEEQTDDDEVCE